MEEDPAVTLFRDYLRIKTVQPDPDYDSAIRFLKSQAKELDLPVRCYQEHWKYDAFDAYKEPNGDIYGRGTQDMKCVAIQYLEAIRRLKANGRRFERTIHLSFVPDEEVGGEKGMESFLNTLHFKDLNVAFVLDEGLANPRDAFTVFYGERSPWWINITAKGRPGHGSRFVEDNPGEKIRRVINSFLEMRDKEERRMKDNPDLLLGDVTSVNLTKLSGGIQTNVIPTEFKATFDIRVTPTVNLDQFEEQIKTWCNEAGPGVTYEFEQKFLGKNITHLTEDNMWWKAFQGACTEMAIPIEKEIFPAATDSRFLRAAGYPCIGFSPMNNTPILLHDHNEFLNENVFLRGIQIYEKIIPALASVGN